MGTRASSGFTIIETLLFLGVTGLLVMGALIGVGANVNIQRYRDAAETFKNTIQQQYSSTTNVQNGRDNNWICNNAAGAIPSANGQIRGQSDCVMVGKYVRIIGSDISSYTVLARKNFAPSPTTNDIASIRTGYTLNIAKSEIEKKTMEWGSEIAWPKKGPGAKTPATPRSIALLFIRSPDSGQVYTFTSNTVPSDADMDSLQSNVSPAFLSNMIVAGNQTPGQGEQLICIESSGLFDKGQMGLYMAPFAATTNSIELMSNQMMVTRGVNAEC